MIMVYVQLLQNEIPLSLSALFSCGFCWLRLSLVTSYVNRDVIHVIVVFLFRRERCG